MISREVRMNSEDVLKREIAELRAQIKIREAALHTLHEGQSKAGDPKLRFYKWRPVDAVRVLLREHGNRLDRSKAEALMVEGGITVGRKRGPHNIRISLDRNIEIGNLRQENGVLTDPLEAWGDKELPLGHSAILFCADKGQEA